MRTVLLGHGWLSFGVHGSSGLPIPVHVIHRTAGCGYWPGVRYPTRPPMVFRVLAGVPESARLLFRSPAYWVHHLDQEDAIAATVNLQRDAGLMTSNLQVLSQLVTSLDRMSSEVLHLAGWVRWCFRRQKCQHCLLLLVLRRRPIIWLLWDYGDLRWALVDIILQYVHEL